MKKIRNKSGVELEFSEQFESVCRKHYGKSDDDPLTEQEILSFVRSAFSSAINKGVALEIDDELTISFDK